MTNDDYLIKKVFRKYLFFTVLSFMASPVGLMVDGIVIGNFLGKEAIAAVGLFVPFYFLLTAFTSVIASGSISLCGKYIGSEQLDRVRHIFSLAMLWSGAIYFVIMAVSLCLPEQMAYLLGARGTLVPLTADYISGLGLGIGLNVLHLTLVEFTKLDGSPELGVISVAAMIIVNITLDLCNVFWWQKGIFGIALATSISYIAAILVCLIHFLKPINTLKLVKNKTLYRDSILILNSGLSRGIGGVCLAITGVIVNYRLNFLGGSMALAAFAIQSNIMKVITSINKGVGNTTLLLSGIFYGEEDKKTLESVVKISLIEGVFIGIVGCTLCFIFLNPIIGLFVQENSAVAKMAFSAVSWQLVWAVLLTVVIVFLNYYQGVGNLKMSNVLRVIESLLTQVIYIIILPMFMGVNGVWASSVMSTLTTFFILTMVVAYKNKRFPRHIKEYLMFPPSFGVQDSMQLNFSISNDLQAIVGVSEQVATFCEKQGVSARHTHHLALCVEEMAGNVVRYAFTDEKPHFIDIRISRKEKQLIFRLRDDGKPFNPLQEQPNNEAEFGRNIGIHLVKRLAHSIDYRYTVGLNNLLIKL